MKSIPLDGFEFQEIKTQPISLAQLEQLFPLTGSYESIFSRRAKKYSSMGLKDQELSETDYKQLILSDYTFLKRPVIIIDQDIFIGSDKKTLQQLKDYFSIG
jgi:arsenate reductase